MNRQTPDTATHSRPEGRSYRIGDRIAGTYEIQDIFGGEGSSAMGIVYKCFDRGKGDILTLKTLQDRYLTSPKVAENFRKEALAWIRLEQHPNIVRAFWVRELDSHIFVACEFIMHDASGRNTLTHYLKEPFSLRQSLTWAIQFSYGMEYACSKGVTPHRDIKPDNLMVTFDGIVKISDFGLAGVSEKVERVIAGSPPWMAPEQFYGISEAASDIYSFGIVLFQLVNRGELPFQPRGADSWGKAHKTYPLPRIPSKGQKLEGIIRKCLEKRRDMRYRNFAELRADLEKVFRHEITRETGEEPPAPPVIEALGKAGLANKGLSLTNLGFVDEGIKHYKEGLKTDPKNAMLRNNLGNALVRKGQVDDAVREFREAIRLDRDCTAAHYNLGNALFNKGLLNDAVKSYREAIRTNRGFTDAYMNLGSVYFRKGLLDQAIETYRQATKTDPGSADAFKRLGLSLFKKGMLDEAVQAYQDALRLRPDSAEICNNLGAAFFAEGLMDEAINAYGKAVAIEPGHVDAYYNLGIAFFKKDLPREAMYAFEAFIRSAPAGDSRTPKANETVTALKRKLGLP